MLRVPHVYEPLRLSRMSLPKQTGGKERILKNLIVAEKPSVAKAIAGALGIQGRQDGYLENESTIITWCVGHLAGLADAELYDSTYKNWDLAQLPILPEAFRYTVPASKQKQFGILKALMNREDISGIVNACDAGREGELIFRTVYNLSGSRKPVKRLWISSMEDAAIRDAFGNLRDSRAFDGLYQAALCRSKADWLVGINATRFFTLQYHRKLKVGRVMSPTLAILVQRESEIQAFVSEPYYTIQIDLGEFIMNSEKYSSRQEAASLLGACLSKSAKIDSVERTEKAESAPHLFDLTTLQREANRVLGYTAQQSLDYLQNLYEKKLCTYPRTDSRYLTDDMCPKVPDYVAVAAKLAGTAIPSVIHDAAVCDSNKVSDHFALLPTLSAADYDLVSLPAAELVLLKLLALSVLRAVSDPYEYTELCVKASCGGVPFSSKTKIVRSLGWRQYLSVEAAEAPSVIPTLESGQTLPIRDAQIREGKTTPPKRYSEASLLSAMENAGAEGFPEGAEHSGIGTPATRAGIIEKLVSDGYVERKHARKSVHLVPTQLGTALITVLPEELQSPHLTAEWEQQLKQIERGDLTPEQFDYGIRNMLVSLIHDYKPVDGAEVLFSDSSSIVGKCPRCGFPVIERQKGFFCSNRDCSFALWKQNRFFAAKRKDLTSAVAEALLNDGKVRLKGCYSEKKNKTYDATVMLDDDGERTNFKIIF